tara:strand:+ start:2691 stop:4430 length:1740 start_codon:yes stop_codon:yes gene_type:complete
MAITPIKYYGKFTPTGVDTSAANKYRALAGLANDIGRISLEAGAAYVEKKGQENIKRGEEEGLQAGMLAATDGDNFDVFSNKDTGTLYGESFINAAEASYIAGTKNDLQNDLLRIEAENPSSVVDYGTLSQQSFNARRDKLPASAQPDFQLYYDQINRTGASRVGKAQKQIIDDQNTATFQEYANNQEINVSNLARNGDWGDLAAAELSLINQGKTAIEAGILKPAQLQTLLQNNRQTIIEQSQLGLWERNVIEGDGTVAERIALGESIIAELKNQDEISVPNPSNPEEVIKLSADDADALIAKIEGRQESFEQGEIKKAEETLEQDRFTQIANYQTSMDVVTSSVLTDDQKLLQIATDELRGNIAPAGAVLLRRYVNSAAKLTAVTSSDFVADIIDRAYDLSASYDYEGNSTEYLGGMNNLREDILTGAATGNLSQVDQTKLENTLRSLSAAKVAGATTEIADNYFAAKEIIKVLPLDLRGVATRKLFDEVNLEVLRMTEANGEPPQQGVINNLWKSLAPQVVNKIQAERRTNAISVVNTVTAQSRQTLIPTVTTQSEVDALPSGAVFIEAGLQYTKP